MPAITSGKVLVTGATGYIAEWVIEKLLQQGFSVRGTVRSDEKGTSLKGLYAPFGDKFEFAVVPDMTKSGSFNEAIEGVDAVLHVASPVSLAADDPSEVIRPAVDGTSSILESILRYGASVKRLVFTSSCGAVYTVQPEYRVFNESDWNESSLKEVETKGREAPQMDKYRASKILAERAVWDFAEKHKNDRKFDIVVLNPPGVFGPSHRFTARTIDEVSGSTRYWIEAIKGAKSDSEYLLTGGEWVDIRDVAQAHVLALKNPDVAEQRIIVSAGPYKFQEWVNIANRINNKLPTGNSSFDPANPNYTLRFDVSKATKYFGIQYISKEQATEDMLDQFEKNGLL